MQKCSLIDYPDQVSCVIFTQGCNFRCPYCHNRELVLPEYFKETLPDEDVLSFLESRCQYLDGVVITGGEPSEQEDLLQFMTSVKAMGFLLKLDTNGSRPHIIREVLQQGLADYIAMDVKTSFEKYHKAIGVAFPIELIQESMELIQDSGIPHEFRTTVVNPFCKFEDVCGIASQIKEKKNYRLQAFRESEKIINPNIHKIKQYSNEDIESWKEKI